MTNLPWLIKSAAWAFLILTMVSRRWARGYPLVLVYVLAGIAIEICHWLAADLLGRQSINYTYVYISLSFVLVGLAVAVLLKIYSVFGQLKLGRDWHLLVGAAGVALLGLFDSRPIWPLFRLLDISFTLLTFVGAATVVRMIRKRREVDLGWNLKMVLLALTLPASFYTLVFATYTMGMDLSYENATYWIQGASLASWIILAAGMSHYSPPRRVGLPSLEAKAVLDGDSSANENGSERFAEEECHTGGVSF